MYFTHLNLNINLKFSIHYNASLEANVSGHIVHLNQLKFKSICLHITVNIWGNFILPWLARLFEIF